MSYQTCPDHRPTAPYPVDDCPVCDLLAEVADLKEKLVVAKARNGMEKAINILGAEGFEKAAIYLCNRTK